MDANKDADEDWRGRSEYELGKDPLDHDIHEEGALGAVDIDKTTWVYERAVAEDFDM